MKYTIDQLRSVKGIGDKAIERIIEQFSEKETKVFYDKGLHIGENEIRLGDMLIEMNGIPDNSVDLILTDLPYGTTASQWDKIIPEKEMWKHYQRVISPNGSIVLFASGQFSPYVMSSNLDDFKYRWVWEKTNSTNFVHAKNRPMTKSEDILVFSKAPMGHRSQLGDRRMTYNPQGLTEVNEEIKLGNGRFGTVAGKRPSHKDVFTRTHTGYPTDLLLGFPEDATNAKYHTNQKPLSLLEYLIKTYTDVGDLVLDSTMGSGSTCVASRNVGRKYIGIELDDNYFNIAKERLKL